MMPFGVLSKAVSPRHAPDTLAKEGAQVDGRLALNQVMRMHLYSEAPCLKKRTEQFVDLGEHLGRLQCNICSTRGLSCHEDDTTVFHYLRHAGIGGE